MDLLVDDRIEGLDRTEDNSKEHVVDIYLGNREEEFKSFLSGLLRRCCFPREIVEMILSKDNIYFEKYCCVFTHKSVNKLHNYEYYELLGDQTMNKIILFYLKDKFPFLGNAEGIKVLSRLKINLVSKLTYSKWAEDLGFLPFISCDEEIRKKSANSLLEDVLEAFCGLSEIIADKEVKGYTGLYFISKFVEQLLDTTSISLEYTSLYDSVTRLKELFDKYNSHTYKNTCPYIYGSISFTHEKLENGYFLVHLCQSGPSSHRKDILLSEKGRSINDIKLKLSEDYLQFLGSKGYKKEELPYYAMIEQMRIKNEMELDSKIDLK